MMASQKDLKNKKKEEAKLKETNEKPKEEVKTENEPNIEPPVMDPDTKPQTNATEKTDDNDEEENNIKVGDENLTHDDETKKNFFTKLITKLKEHKEQGHKNFLPYYFYANLDDDKHQNRIRNLKEATDSEPLSFEYNKGTDTKPLWVKRVMRKGMAFITPKNNPDSRPYVSVNALEEATGVFDPNSPTFWAKKESKDKDYVAPFTSEKIFVNTKGQPFKTGYYSLETGKFVKKKTDGNGGPVVPTGGASGMAGTGGSFYNNTIGNNNFFIFGNTSSPIGLSGTGLKLPSDGTDNKTKNEKNKSPQLPKFEPNSKGIEETHIYERDFSNPKTLIKEPTIMSSVLALIKHGNSKFKHSWYRENNEGQLYSLPESVYTTTTHDFIKNFVDTLKKDRPEIYSNFESVSGKYLERFKNLSSVGDIATMQYEYHHNPSHDRDELYQLSNTLKERFFMYARDKKQYLIPGDKEKVKYSIDDKLKEIPLNKWDTNTGSFKLSSYNIYSDEYDDVQETPAMKMGKEQEKETGPVIAKMLNQFFGDRLGKNKFQKTTYFRQHQQSSAYPILNIFSTPDLSATDKEGKLIFADIKSHTDTTPYDSYMEAQTFTRYYDREIHGYRQNNGVKQKHIRYDVPKKSLEVYNIHNDPASRKDNRFSMVDVKTKQGKLLKGDDSTRKQLTKNEKKR